MFKNKIDKLKIHSMENTFNGKTHTPIFLNSFI